MFSVSNKAVCLLGDAWTKSFRGEDGSGRKLLGDSNLLLLSSAIFLLAGLCLSTLRKAEFEAPPLSPAKQLVEWGRSRRGRFTEPIERLIGEPLPWTDFTGLKLKNMDGVPGSAKISKSSMNDPPSSALKSVLTLPKKSSYLDPGVSLTAESSLGSCDAALRNGESIIFCTFCRCRRRFVPGEAEGGGLRGAFNFMAGVKGGSI
jgi:hypothetical protein